MVKTKNYTDVGYRKSICCLSKLIRNDVGIWECIACGKTGSLQPDENKLLSIVGGAENAGRNIHKR